MKTVRPCFDVLFERRTRTESWDSYRQVSQLSGAKLLMFRGGTVEKYKSVPTFPNVNHGFQGSPGLPEKSGAVYRCSMPALPVQESPSRIWLDRKFFSWIYLKLPEFGFTWLNCIQAPMCPSVFDLRPQRKGRPSPVLCGVSRALALPFEPRFQQRFRCQRSTRIAPPRRTSSDYCLRIQ